MKGAIVITSWVCVTLIVALVLWMIQPRSLDWGTIIFILILFAIPFALSIGYAMYEPSRE